MDLSHIAIGSFPHAMTVRRLRASVVVRAKPTDFADGSFEAISQESTGRPGANVKSMCPSTLVLALESDHHEYLAVGNV